MTDCHQAAVGSSRCAGTCLVMLNASTKAPRPMPARQEKTEKPYVVRWGDAGDENSVKVDARNAGEAVWLVHSRNRQLEGTQYAVEPLDKSDPPRNFTVGHAGGGGTFLR